MGGGQELRPTVAKQWEGWGGFRLAQLPPVVRELQCLP